MIHYPYVTSGVISACDHYSSFVVNLKAVNSPSMNPINVALQLQRVKGVDFYAVVKIATTE
jgi:hypothetical protein